MENILLIGFKASGKSSAGKALASLLGLPFIDTDTITERLYLERNGAALNCREIYSRLGADAMRALETEALREAASGPRAVIATGGGAILHQDNRHILKEAGFCVFLDTPLPLLEKRLEEHRDSPLFKNKSVNQVHGERYRLYTSAADLRYLPEPGESPEETAQRIWMNIRQSVRPIICTTIGEAAHG